MSPLFSNVFIIAARTTLSMIPVVALSLPDAEVYFLSSAKLRRLFFGTESKSDLTLLKTRSSKNFISFASRSA